MQKLQPAAADADAEAVSFPAYQTDRPHSRNIPDHPPDVARMGYESVPSLWKPDIPRQDILR